MQALSRFSHKPLTTISLLQNASRFLTTGNGDLSPFPDGLSSVYYDDLINAAGRNRDFATIHHLLNKRMRDGFFNTTNTFRFISIDLSIIDDLLQTLARLDKGFTRKSAYDALITRLCKSHRPDEALRVAHVMVQGAYGANACTFHPILSELTRRKEMKKAWHVMELMRKNEIPHDLTAYNYLLTSYCYVGDLESAAGVLTRIVEEGMEADTRTYDALVLGACRTGKVEGALMVLRRMLDDGVSPLYSTHAHVIGTLLNMGYYPQAVEFVMSYGGRNKGLDTENFGLLATRLINLNKSDEAKLVLEEMKKRGLFMGGSHFMGIQMAN